MTLTMGFLVLFRSIAAVIFSLDLKQYGAKYWWVLMALALLGIFFSFALLMSHMLSGGMIVIWTGLSFISAGVYNLVLSLRLRKLRGISSRLSEELMAKYREIQREVQQELSNPIPELRYEAALACGKLQLRETVDELEELADDADPEVQEAALWALGQIGGEKARKVLERYCQARDEATRTAAEAAMDELEFLHGDLSDFFTRLMRESD